MDPNGQNALVTSKLLEYAVYTISTVIPVVVAWYIRTFVKSANNEKDVAVIVRLANTAIDYVENLDQRNELEVPEGARKGIVKLQKAGQWLEDELKRSGVKISNEEAEKWVASKYQERMGGVRPVGAMAQVTGMAVDLIEDLDAKTGITLPAGVEQHAYLLGQAADWVTVELAKQNVTMTREEALSWVQAEILQRLRLPAIGQPAAERLTALAGAAVEFVARLKDQGRLKIQPAGLAVDIDADLVTAWILVEAAKQGLPATTSQIAAAVSTALAAHQSELPAN